MNADNPNVETFKSLLSYLLLPIVDQIATWMSPLGACITITQSITIASFNSLIRWGKTFFPSHPLLFRPLSNAGCCFRSFVFECPHLYWARKVFNFDPCKLFMISKHDLLKRLWAFVHSHLIPPLVCPVEAQQMSFRICCTVFHVCVNGRMGENIKLHFLVVCRTK